MGSQVRIMGSCLKIITDGDDDFFLTRGVCLFIKTQEVRAASQPFFLLLRRAPGGLTDLSD